MPEPESEGAAIVQGHVTNQGHPVSGARVVVVQAPVAVPEIVVLTDAGGRFVFTLPAPGLYVFEVIHGSSARAARVNVNVEVERSAAMKSPEAENLEKGNDDEDMSSEDSHPAQGVSLGGRALQPQLLQVKMDFDEPAAAPT